MAEMQEKLDAIHEKLIEVSTNQKKIQQELSFINTHVFMGNGKPSILARTEAIEVIVSSLVWFKRLAIGGAITGIIGLGTAVATAAIALLG